MVTKYQIQIVNSYFSADAYCAKRGICYGDLYGRQYLAEHRNIANWNTCATMCKQDTYCNYWAYTLRRKICNFYANNDNPRQGGCLSGHYSCTLCRDTATIACAIDE